MENFEKKFNNVNNSVNNASTRTGNKFTAATKNAAALLGTAVAIMVVGMWAKKKFFSKPSPEVEEVKKVDENGFEEIKETKK